MDMMERVAHPGLVSIAKEIFETNISGPNQINKQGMILMLMLKIYLILIPLRHN